MKHSLDRQELTCLFHLQRWDELLQGLDGIDLAAARDPELWFFYARAQRGLGQPELGYLALAEAMALDPASLDLRFEAVVALQQQQQWSTALDLLEAPEASSALQLPLVRLYRARCWAHLGAALQAEQELTALQQEPGLDLLLLGQALVEVSLQLGDLAKAKFCLARALELVGDQPNEELALLQIDLLAADWNSDQRPVLDQLQQNYLHSCRVQLAAAKLLQRHLLVDSAAAILRQAVEVYDCSGCLGRQWLELLASTGQLALLRQWMAKANAIFPFQEPRLFEAQCLINLNRDTEALALLAEAPNDHDVLALRALLQARSGAYEASLLTRRELMRVQPNSADLAYQLAFELLRLGQWEEGWHWYEERFLCSYASTFVPPGITPRQSGLSPAGQHVLVFAEQGFGDAIMLASMLPDLCQVAQSVCLFVQPRLAPLLQSSFPVIRVISALTESEFASFDACYGIGSLGKFFRTSQSDFPGSAYLHVPAADLAEWKQQLNRLGPLPKIGVAWKGGGHLQQHQRRSLELFDLLPILQCGDVNWINLQYRHSPQELEQFQQAHGVSIHHFDGITEDLLQTAALTQALDLVITVQQTALHIAGAIGTEAWVMVPVAPEWRYGTERSQMPWYSSVELFRQESLGDWSSPIQMVQSRLVDWLSAFAGQNEATS